MVLYMAFFTYKEIVLAAKDGGYMGKPISDIRDEFNKADLTGRKNYVFCMQMMKGRV